MTIWCCLVVPPGSEMRLFGEGANNFSRSSASDLDLTQGAPGMKEEHEMEKLASAHVTHSFHQFIGKIVSEQLCVFLLFVLYFETRLGKIRTHNSHEQHL